MRQERTVQASLFDLFAGHEIGRELKAISQWLDEHPALVKLVSEDLRGEGAETGGAGCRWNRCCAAGCSSSSAN